MIKKSSIMHSLIFFTAFLLLVGCSSSSKAASKKSSQELSLNYAVSPISQDDKNMVTEVTIINKTDYDFTPIAVFVRPDRGDSSSILVEASSDYNGFPKEIKYKVSVPKDIFTLDSKSVIQVYGFFSDKDKNILSVIKDAFDIESKEG